MLPAPFRPDMLLIQIFIERRLRRHFARIVDDAALMSRGHSFAPAVRWTAMGCCWGNMISVL
jgi:hypothetical protein